MKASFIIPCLLSLNALIKVCYPAIQHIISVGVGHSSKSVCSGVFLSNRSVESIQENELQGLTSYLVVPRVNYTDESVTSTFFGVSRQISEALNLRVGTAKYLGPSFGCSLTMDTFKKPKEYYDFQQMKDMISLGVTSELEATSTPSSQCNEEEATSSGGSCLNKDVALDDESEVKVHKQPPSFFNVKCFNDILDSEFSDEAYATNQSRAIVISYDNQILAERYQSRLQIHENTKLLGWSMTKSVFSAIVGTAIEQGLLTLDTPAKLEHLRPEQRERLMEKNNGQPITFRHLLQMYDILGFVEDYGPMKDVVFMLYGTYETVKFASTRPSYPDPERLPSEGWYYSSAVSNLLSSELRALFASDADYWAFPHTHLFAKINATSFAIEMDAAGTFVASSFAYATARDWTKMGELLMNNGQHQGVQIVNKEFMDFATATHSHAGGYYGAQLWLNPASASDAEDKLLPPTHSIREKNGWLREVLPSDSYFMSGHDGQSVFILPSQRLVITRLGFTKQTEYTHHLLASLMTCVSVDV